MAHVELSLSEAPTPRTPVGSSLDRWAVAVAQAAEACLAIDSQAMIIAVSPSCHELLGLARPGAGHNLLDGVLQLLDFSSDGGLLDEGEVGKIPPLLALSSGRLARGLLRVRCAAGACTLDAIATPLVDGDTVTGSLTFFSQV